MASEVVIRRAQPGEYGSVRTLVETVANETFRDLFAPNPVPLDFEDEDWSLAWVAVSGGNIVGVIMTNQEWVSDLWVLREHRGQGVGSRLLSRGEAEIAARGHQACRLRVVRSNAVAVQFYLGRGWWIAREFAHEKYHHAMLEMARSLPTSPAALPEPIRGRLPFVRLRNG
jgi:GNAT superfamily N-acetyltransferase